MTMVNVANAFKPIIRRENGAYWASVPAMPGCFTVADTLVELKSNIVEAMKCWLLTRADLVASQSERHPARQRVYA